MASTLPNGRNQFFDNNGGFLVGGKLYTYQPGPGITTPKTTYSDAAATVPHTNPIILDARGEATIFWDGGYNIRLENSLGGLIYTVENINTDPSASALDATLRADLANNSDPAKGAGMVGFFQSGGGAVGRTALDKLREIASRDDFSSDANFNAGKGNKPNIDGGNNFNAKATPSGEVQGELADFLRPVPSGPRDAIMYASITSVSVFRDFATMGGFRFRGQYKNSRAPVFPMPASKAASVSSGLGAESAVATENWYAIFACANDGDAAAVIKTMPFLRAGVPAGSNIPLVKAGEQIHSLIPKNYTWSSANNLANVDCLVINESGSFGASQFSGRVTKITANSASQITLASVGSLAAYNYLLPAPPGYEHYVYLGSFYFDTAEVRNIADSGLIVKAKMSGNLDPNFTASGSVPVAVEIHWGGYIPPLATGVIMKETFTLSTGSTGNHASYYWHDSSLHEIESTYSEKTQVPNETYVYDNITLPFSFQQSSWYSTAGSLAAQRASGTLEIKGWIEP